MKNNILEFYKKKLSESIIKENLFINGIKKVMAVGSEDLEYLKKCFQILEDEQSLQNYLLRQIEFATTGRNMPREQAEKVLREKRGDVYGI